MNAELAAQLLEANEQLVLAVIRAQDDALQAAQALKKVPAPTAYALTSHTDGAVLFNHLVHAQAQARRTGGKLGLLLVSIENLQAISDSMGLSLGREAASVASQRLVSMVRNSDIVSRHGDSQFLVLLPAVAGAEAALNVADSIIAALVLPARVAGRSIRLTATVGVSIFPDDGSDGDALIDRAVAAMYSARRRGLGSFFFRGETGTDARSTELRLSESAPRPASATDAKLKATADAQRDANEQLLLAGLRTHELLAASEEAYRRQAEFLGVVAHELRGPLGPISHAAELLSYLKTPEPVVPVVRGVIERQVAHMRRLVADLLDITRISTGQIHLDIQRLDLGVVIAQAVEEVQGAIGAKHQKLLLDVTKEPLPANGDPLRLTQVVCNLLSNASKYTHSGGQIVLRVSVIGDRARIVVKDNGIGISPDAVSQVFDPFVQEERAKMFDSSGLGIGLSLVRELVRGHDGVVSASSEGQDRGSEFVVELPLLPRTGL